MQQNYGLSTIANTPLMGVFTVGKQKTPENGKTNGESIGYGQKIVTLQQIYRLWVVDERFRELKKYKL